MNTPVHVFWWTQLCIGSVAHGNFLRGTAKEVSKVYVPVGTAAGWEQKLQLLRSLSALRNFWILATGTWVIGCFAKSPCMKRDAWAGVLSWWSYQSPVTLSCSLRNHLNSFHRGMFKLHTKSDADLLFYSLSHFECDETWHSSKVSLKKIFWLLYNTIISPIWNSSQISALHLVLLLAIFLSESLHKNYSQFSGSLNVNSFNWNFLETLFKMIHVLEI